MTSGSEKHESPYGRKCPGKDVCACYCHNQPPKLDGNGKMIPEDEGGDQHRCKNPE